MEEKDPRLKMIDDCEEMMRKLEATQQSILEASELLQRVSQRDPSLVPFIVELWSRLLARSHRSKKVAYVFLVNDVISRSARSAIALAFEETVDQALKGLFEKQLFGREYGPIKAEIIKVLGIWVNKKLFVDTDRLAKTIDFLVKIGQLSEE